MKVAVVGTVGVPACYGGFETLVENLIGEHCSDDIEYTVFCSSKTLDRRLKSYKHAKLEYVPFKANGMQSVIYDAVSMLRVFRGYDVILYLGASVPMYRWLKRWCTAKIIFNIDGMDHERAKYGSFQKRFLSYLKENGAKIYDFIISDNAGIHDYVKRHYGRGSRMIPYGGDHVLTEVSEERKFSVLSEYGLKSGEYAVKVCRIEPENNCHIVLDAFASSGRQLVLVGNWDYSAYGKELRARYSDYPHIRMLDPIYDLEVLNVLRGEAGMYVHGHMVGGTNPSLVEAMFFGKPVLCYDVVYNRATTFGKADYFRTADELIRLLEHNVSDGEALRELAFSHYTWKSIVAQYEQAYADALAGKCE